MSKAACYVRVHSPLLFIVEREYQNARIKKTGGRGLPPVALGYGVTSKLQAFGVTEIFRVALFPREDPSDATNEIVFVEAMGTPLN